MDKKRECKSCGSIKPNIQCVRLQYEIPYSETDNRFMIENVCGEDCLHKRMKEIRNEYECRVIVTYPHKWIMENVK